MPEIMIHDGFTAKQQDEIEILIKSGLLDDEDFVIFRPQEAGTINGRM
jgi:hypothetical protein